MKRNSFTQSPFEKYAAWLENARDAIVILVFFYALIWLTTLTCVGFHGLDACGL